MREAMIWVVTIHDHCERNEHDSVAIFDEDMTEQQVITELWEDWVAHPYMEDLSADPGMAEGQPPESLPPIPAEGWRLLHEWVGEDFSFMAELRPIKVVS